MRRHWPAVLGALLLALASARPFAGSWNDASRLAAAESLVDRKTWAIDDSIFVNPPVESPSPYRLEDEGLRARGTLDKVKIGGRFFSDKSPAPTLALAGLYKVLQAFTGLRAAEGPGSFCRWLTLFSSGVAYVIAVWCIDVFAGRAELSGRWRAALVASFAIGSVALTYAQHVNQHEWLLAVCGLLFLLLDGVGADRPRLVWLGIGMCAGIGYGIDLGVGPVLAAVTLAWAFFKTKTAHGVAWILCGMLPWIALHHWLNWRLGGTWRPLNMNAAYFSWPGSPFDAGNLTGGWPRRGVQASALYALDLLVGKRGFLMHNPPLFLAVAAFVPWLRKTTIDRAPLIFAAALSVGVWLLYAAASVNSSGVCLSVRWFVPLLAPGYYVLARLLRDAPELRGDFSILAIGGGVLGVAMWPGGPWRAHLVPGFWWITGTTLLAWLAWRIWLPGKNRKSKR